MSNTEKPVAPFVYYTVVELAEAEELLHHVQSITGMLEKLLTGSELTQQNGFIIVNTLKVHIACAQMRSIVKAIRKFTKEFANQTEG
jgi:hypothetical protein